MCEEEGVDRTVRFFVQWGTRLVAALNTTLKSIKGLQHEEQLAVYSKEKNIAYQSGSKHNDGQRRAGHPILDDPQVRIQGVIVSLNAHRGAPESACVHLQENFGEHG